MDNKKYQRRKTLNFSINPQFQAHMIKRITLILFLSLLISSTAFLYFANQEITKSYREFHIQARNFLDYLWPVVVGAFVVSLLAGFVACLFYPNSLAGSLYRIEQDLKQIAEGDLSFRIQLRKEDNINFIAEGINELVDSYRNKMIAFQSILDKSHNIDDREGLLNICMQLQDEIKSFRLDLSQGVEEV